MSWLIFQLVLSAPLTFCLIIGGDGSDTVSSNIVYLHQLLSEERIMRSSLETKIQQMEQRIQNLETNISTKQTVPSSDPTVAFHAYLTKDGGAVHYAHVVFDTVLLNIGNAYSPLHGIFRAPYSGLYLFSVTAAISPGHFLHFYLMKNDKAEEFVFTYSSDWEQGSKTTILELNVDDYVWVEADGQLTGSLSGDNFNHIHMHSSFSGILIKEM
ncbi:hypothetical protein ACJMK2_021661 [Sinanodonta woodiana]|uniref:C1q domain-containing protein n=1 Tax=Sinanodonta woodiana TaxID=1069815 RepID=A0ABD3TGQ5_SINWO